VQVDFATDPAPFCEQNEAWFTWIRTGRPWLRVKVALSLDGRPSLGHGVRTTLTGGDARRLTMKLRAASDAVMIGASTQRIDNARLTVCDAEDKPVLPGPLRVVLARESFPVPTGFVFSEPGRSLLLIGDRADPDGTRRFVESGVEVSAYEAARGLSAALELLARRDVVSVLLEPGPGMFTAAWESGFIDELVLVHAGGVAGSTAPSLYERVSQPGTDFTVIMRAVESGLAGEDAVSVWRRRT